ncbi:MAG: iron ABC transporter permease [Bdellovibrionales bacterium]|nr:iron ABC transporter permease [Bdellovibrionales bacterium]
MMRAGAPARLAVIGAAFGLLAFTLSLKLGVADHLDPELIVQLRLPRALLAAAVGAGLAVAGAALQALFANPLCEPYTLGISSGSALGAVLGGALGLAADYGGVGLTAFAGALVFAAVLQLLGSRGGFPTSSLLLAGVMLGFLGSSLVALWMALADAAGIQGALFWLLGDLSRARLQGAVLTWAAVGLLISTLWSRWRGLDALLLGEEDARALGIDVPALRKRVLISASLLVGFCVSSAGMIGFVGLVVPHFIRRFAGSLHSSLIPLSALWGAAVLMAADLGARLAASPYELPVGVVTALFGAPLFLWVLTRARGTR